MIGLWDFLLGATIIGSISGVIHGAMKTQRAKIKAKALQADGMTSALHEDVAKLKERVRVLEKLVTDDDRRLASEIERLRSGARPGA